MDISLGLFLILFGFLLGAQYGRIEEQIRRVKLERLAEKGEKD